jgi:hypothetical protein
MIILGLFISSLFEMIYFIIQIKYYEFKNIFNIILFNILNNVTRIQKINSQVFHELGVP